MTVESFLLMARETGLSSADMDRMNVGDVLDYVFSWIEFHDPEKAKKPKKKKANQADIDALLGAW